MAARGYRATEPAVKIYVHCAADGGTGLQSQAKQVATVAQATKFAPIAATRHMMRDFYQTHTGTQLPTAVLRLMWDELSGGTRERDSRQQVIDDNVLQWMTSVSVSDEAVFWDMRELNGNDGHKFDPFWDELGSFLELEVGAGAHERRATEGVDIVYAATIISVPQLIREVTTRLHATPGLEHAAIPHESTVRLQFMPNRPTALASSRFTARFRFLRKVQTRCLRKEHEDAHYCLALARNCKMAVVEANHLADEAQRPNAVKAAFGDDKCKIPQGPPGEYVSATARDHAGSNPNNMLANPIPQHANLGCTMPRTQPLTTYYLLLTTYYLLLTTYDSLLTTYYSLLTTHYSLLTIHYSLLTTYYSLLTTYYSLLTIHYSLLTTHYSLLTTHYSLLPIPPHLTLQAVGHVAVCYRRRQ